VAERHNIPRKALYDVWNEVSPDYCVDVNLVLEKERKRKEDAIKQIKKKQKEAELPKCEYVFGKKSKEKAGKACGGPCKDDPDSEGKHYCPKHKKHMDSKHTCEFVFGKRSKQAGEICGCRVNKDASPCDIEEEYNEESYDGKWLCKKHFTQVKKNSDKMKAPKCTYETKTGNECKMRALDGEDFCKKHMPKPKKTKSQPKKSTPTREPDTSDSESDHEDHKEEKKTTKKATKSGATKASTSSTQVTPTLDVNMNLVKGMKDDPTDTSPVKVARRSNGYVYFFVDQNSGYVFVGNNKEMAMKKQDSFDKTIMRVAGRWDNKEMKIEPIGEPEQTKGCEVLEDEEVMTLLYMTQ